MTRQVDYLEQELSIPFFAPVHQMCSSMLLRQDLVSLFTFIKVASKTTIIGTDVQCFCSKAVNLFF